MSKLYEVLENASRERLRLQAEQVVAFEPQPVSKIEKEMFNLYQAIDAVIGRKESRVIQFMGTRPKEGCSTIVRDLARIAATRLEETVLLFDLAPSIDNGTDPNFTCDYHFEETLSDEIPEKAIHRIEKTNLSLTSLSMMPDAPLNAINLSHNAGLWDQLKRRYSLILIDAPPAATSGLGFSLIKNLDGVVLVVRENKTRLPAIVDARDRIIGGGGKVIGAVYNDRRLHIPNWLYKRL